jgi:hypothetical protein
VPQSTAPNSSAFGTLFINEPVPLEKLNRCEKGVQRPMSVDNADVAKSLSPRSVNDQSQVGNEWQRRGLLIAGTQFLSQYASRSWINN